MTSTVFPSIATFSVVLAVPTDGNNFLFGTIQGHNLTQISHVYLVIPGVLFEQVALSGTDTQLTFTLPTLLTETPQQGFQLYLRVANMMDNMNMPILALGGPVLHAKSSSATVDGDNGRVGDLVTFSTQDLDGVSVMLIGMAPDIQGLLPTSAFQGTVQADASATSAPFLMIGPKRYPLRPISRDSYFINTSADLNPSTPITLHASGPDQVTDASITVQQFSQTPPQLIATQHNSRSTSAIGSGSQGTLFAAHCPSVTTAACCTSPSSCANVFSGTIPVVTTIPVFLTVGAQSLVGGYNLCNISQVYIINVLQPTSLVRVESLVITPVALAFIVPRVAPGSGLILLQSRDQKCLIPIGLETILEESPTSLVAQKTTISGSKLLVPVKILPTLLPTKAVGKSEVRKHSGHSKRSSSSKSCTS